MTTAMNTSSGVAAGLASGLAPHIDRQRNSQSVARIFIGIPTVNRPQLVVEAIDSLRNQTFSDYRVIVSDNKSDGDVADQVEQFIASLNDPRFTFHRQPANKGEYGQG